MLAIGCSIDAVVVATVRTWYRQEVLHLAPDDNLFDRASLQLAKNDSSYIFRVHLPMLFGGRPYMWQTTLFLHSDATFEADLETNAMMTPTELSRELEPIVRLLKELGKLGLVDVWRLQRSPMALSKSMLPTFVRLANAPDRRLPIIVMSSPFVIPPQTLSEKLFGLAHVLTLSSDASAELRGTIESRAARGTIFILKPNSTRATQIKTAEIDWSRDALLKHRRLSDNQEHYTLVDEILATAARMLADSSKQKAVRQPILKSTEVCNPTAALGPQVSGNTRSPLKPPIAGNRKYLEAFPIAGCVTTLIRRPSVQLPAAEKPDVAMLDAGDGLMVARAPEAELESAQTSHASDALSELDEVGKMVDLKPRTLFHYILGALLSLIVELLNLIKVRRG